MENLDKLSQEEFSILNQLKNRSTSKITTENLLPRLGKVYKNIHEAYSQINNIEALKRAIFIQWYAVSEPQLYTGIGELNKKAEMENIEKLISLGALDHEFVLMLSHYFSVSDWYFTGLTNGEKLLHLIPQDRPSVKGIAQMHNRGQMGNIGIV